MRCCIRVFSLLVLLLCCIVANSPVTAALVYEGFDYSNAGSNSLVGNNGGTGWGSAWIDPAPTGTVNANPFTTSQDDVSLDSVTYPSSSPFAPIGDRANMAVSTGVTGEVYRILGSGSTVDMNTNGVYYGSFLIRKDTSTATSSDAITFRFISGLTASAVGTPGLRFGIGSTEQFFIGYGNSTTAAESAADSAVLGTTYLAVFKIETSDAAESTPGTDRISLNFYSPTDVVPSTEPAFGLTALIPATSSDIYAMLLNGVRISKNASTSGSIDEIRLGTTWAEVAVPEPCGIVLSVIAIGCVGAVRMRRKK
jgi:hypothetical protein